MIFILGSLSPGKQKPVFEMMVVGSVLCFEWTERRQIFKLVVLVFSNGPPGNLMRLALQL